MEDRAQRPRGVGLGFVAAWLLLAAPSVARAGEPGEATIQWSAPPGCPGATELRAAVERLLARVRASCAFATHSEGER